MTHRILAVALAGLLVGFALADVVSAQLGRSATITFRDGRGREKTESGVTVVSHTAKGAEVQLSGRRERLIPEDAIISISYARTPEAYTEALEMIKDGDYREAVDKLEELLADERTMRSHRWLKQEALYAIWRAQTLAGRFADAEKTAERLVSEVPDSRYAPQILLAKARALRARGNVAEADAILDRILAKAESGDFAPGFATEAKILKLELALDRGDSARARSLLAEIRSQARSDDDKLVADVWEGRILIAEKKYRDALRHFQRLIERADGKPFVLAAAANGLGDCHFELGEFEEACFEFSKAPALYYDDPELQEEVAWALWRWSNSCRRIANSIDDVNDPRREAMARRFRSLRRRVADEFPLTRGGQLARRELGAQ